MGDTKTGIYGALAKAQIAMGPALKDSTNPAFKSKYADLASVMAACLPALNSNGIAVIQPPIDDESGARFVKTILAHESGETLECRVPLIIGKNDMQGYGSAVTYARRYGLMSMAGIAPEDDDGNAAAAAKPNAKDEAEAREKAKAADQAKHDRAVDQAIVYIGEADSVDTLKQSWMNLPTAMKEDGRVIKAKDDRKAALSAPPKNDDLGKDEIPY